MEFLNVKIDVTIIRQASARVDPAGEHERFFCFLLSPAQPRNGPTHVSPFNWFMLANVNLQT